MGFSLWTAATILGNLLLASSNAANIVFDDTPGYGGTFDGIGGISGGGATSKLLVNYPQAQRDEILDYLFKPNFGASLQILKVEIGGDAQSTDGTEASHMHYSWEENYERGYEWWLMVEAKKRNPDIKLYALPWGFPGWLGEGKTNPYTNPDNLADYVVRWINGAKTHYDLTIDFIGIWNERSYSIYYIKTLRSVLDQRGFQNVQIIASDGDWGIASDISKDQDLAKIVYAIGAHYPGTVSSTAAKATRKVLWSSEDFSTFNDEVGAGCWARILNQNYVNGNMTSTISWNLIASYYPGLPYDRDGLMTAFEPWSGNYIVKSPIWISAHTTQFTSIGWKYLADGNGVGKLPNGGSYVALASPDGNDFTIIIETMSHDHSKCIRPYLPEYNVTDQVITIILKGSFSKIAQLNMWYSKLGFGGNVSNTFVNRGPIVFKDGNSPPLSLGIDEVITLTTLSSGLKGSHPEPPQSAPFTLPYSDDFEDTKLYAEPNNLAPQTGSFEVLRDASNNNNFIRQTVLFSPVVWCQAEQVNKSIALIGSNSWNDLSIEVDFSIPDVNGTDGVFIAARVAQSGCDTSKAQGVFFFALNESFSVSSDLARTKVLGTGSLPPLSGSHKLSLSIKGHTATGFFDGTKVITVDFPNTTNSGFAGIGTDNFGLADFDNLNITQV
jgi:galactosylceramidase